MSTESLVEPFVRALEDESRAPPSTHDEIASLLRDRLDVARRAWPQISVPDDEFVRFLAERAPRDESIREGLRAARSEDLYLACACTRGDEAAIEAFRARYGPDVDRAISRVRTEGDASTDVRQQVFERLFVAKAGAKPKITEYGGRGDLHGWTRAVALRTALNAVRGNRHEVPLEDALGGALASGDDDPELRYLKLHYRAEFRAAFESAVRALGDRERGMLQYHYVDGLGVEEIGRVYRVHASNVSRGLARARAGLLSATRQHLSTRLRIDSSELESVMRLIQSRLEVSLEALLRAGR